MDSGAIIGLDDVVMGELVIEAVEVISMGPPELIGELVLAGAE